VEGGGRGRRTTSKAPLDELLQTRGLRCTADIGVGVAEPELLGGQGCGGRRCAAGICTRLVERSAWLQRALAMEEVELAEEAKIHEYVDVDAIGAGKFATVHRWKPLTCWTSSTAPVSASAPWAWVHEELKTQTTRASCPLIRIIRS
jgi:hypothetical protein